MSSRCQDAHADESGVDVDVDAADDAASSGNWAESEHYHSGPNIIMSARQQNLSTVNWCVCVCICVCVEGGLIKKGQQSGGLLIK